MSGLASMTSIICMFAALAWTASALRLKARDIPEAFPEPWHPPTEYSLYTGGHRTMYLVDVTVGEDNQEFRMLVDTGSEMLVLPSTDCTPAACGQHHRLHVPNAKRGGRHVSQEFGTGAVKGHIAKARLCFANAGSQQLEATSFLQQATRLLRRRFLRRAAEAADDDDGFCARLGVMAVDEESEEFRKAPFDGILGLGPRDPSIEHQGLSVLDALYANKKLASTNFALRLSDAGESELVLGDIDESALATGQALWVPLSSSSGTFWQFTVSDISLDGKPQGIGSFEAIVDSGTSLLAADDGMRAWLLQQVAPGSCQAVDRLPKIQLQLSTGAALTLLPADYIDQTYGKCSLALMPGNVNGANGARMILGDSFMRRYITIFDRSNGRLGFGVSNHDTFSSELLPAMFPGSDLAELKSRIRATTTEPASSMSSDNDEAVGTDRATPDLVHSMSRAVMHQSRQVDTSDSDQHEPSDGHSGTDVSDATPDWADTVSTATQQSTQAPSSATGSINDQVETPEPDQHEPSQDLENTMRQAVMQQSTQAPPSTTVWINYKVETLEPDQHELSKERYASGVSGATPDLLDQMSKTVMRQSPQTSPPLTDMIDSQIDQLTKLEQNQNEFPDDPFVTKAPDLAAEQQTTKDPPETVVVHDSYIDHLKQEQQEFLDPHTPSTNNEEGVEDVTSSQQAPIHESKNIVDGVGTENEFPSASDWDTLVAKMNDDKKEIANKAPNLMQLQATVKTELRLAAPRSLSLKLTRIA